MQEQYEQLTQSKIKDLREEILKKQNFKCAICGKEISETDGISLDHQHRISKSQEIGEDGAGNNMYNTKFQHNFVYLIWNKINHKKYIGTKSSNEEPKNVIGHTYFSCSKDKDFMNEQKEHPENFRYKVLKDFKTRKEALNLECELHHRYKVDTNDDFYNRAMQTSDGFDCHFKHEHWPDWVKEKISKSQIGKKISHETIEKHKATIKKKGLNKGEKNPMYGKRHSEETLAKIRSNPNISHKKENHPLWGTHRSEETKRKISLANKGKSRMTEKHKAEISKINTGAKWMYNLELKECHRVDKRKISEFLEKGYQYGRIRNFDNFEN